jgi:hypothetical protein
MSRPLEARFIRAFLKLYSSRPLQELLASSKSKLKRGIEWNIQTFGHENRRFVFLSLVLVSDQLQLLALLF